MGSVNASRIFKAKGIVNDYWIVCVFGKVSDK